MNHDKYASREHEKERARAEIENHVREYLLRGGTIENISPPPGKPACTVREVWHDQQDLPTGSS